MKLKTLGVVSFVTIALAFAACGKKNNARTQNEGARPTVKNQPIAPTSPTRDPISPKATNKTEIEGIWWTDCVQNGAAALAVRFDVQGDVIARSLYDYDSMDTCLSDDVNASLGFLNTTDLNKTYISYFALVKIDGDGVMTHRVAFKKNDGSDNGSIVIRLKTENGKTQFLSSGSSFLTSRDTANYGYDFFKY